MAKASDCGSEDRGFESHYPPHKNKALLTECLVFMEWIGTRKGVKKTCRWHVFSPWESPRLPERGPLGPGAESRSSLQKTPWVLFFYGMNWDSPRPRSARTVGRKFVAELFALSPRRKPALPRLPYAEKEAAAESHGSLFPISHCVPAFAAACFVPRLMRREEISLQARSSTTYPRYCTPPISISGETSSMV